MLLNFYAHVQEIHWRDQQKQRSNLGQSESYNNVHLATSAQSISYFGLVGSPQKMCTSHTLINIFYILTWHQVIEGARQDEKDMLSLPWSVESHSAMRHQRHVEVKASQSEASKTSWTFVRSPRSVKIQSVGDACLAQQQMFLMSLQSFKRLSEGIMKLY